MILWCGEYSFLYNKLYTKPKMDFTPAGFSSWRTSNCLLKKLKRLERLKMLRSTMGSLWGDV